MSPVVSGLLAVLSGVLMAMAYPPYNLGFCAYFGIAPLLYLVVNLPVRRLWRWVFLSGLVFFVLSVSWIRQITWAGMLFAVVVMSFFYMLPFLLMRCVYVRRRWVAYAALPFAVTAVEWGRSFDQLAFPWMIFGNSQAAYPYLIQFADITSVFGVSAWVVAVNVAVFLFIRKKDVLRAGLIGVLFIVPALYSHMVLRSADGAEPLEYTFALVQGNIKPADKWRIGNEMWNINRYLDLSRTAMEDGPDMIVWPETATPVWLAETPRYRALVQSFVDSLNVPILTGMPSLDLDTGESWNAAGFFQPFAEMQRYNKIHLVPVGEAWPYDEYFPYLKTIDVGQANWSRAHERVVFTSNHVPPFSTVICFESILPDLVRSFVVKGAEFLVVITNDAWFSAGGSPEQHAMISVLRAIECHRPVVRCANTGITMVIDRYGRIVGHTEMDVTTTLTASVAPNSSGTFYLRYGNVFSFAALILSVAACIYCIVGRTQR